MGNLWKSYGEPRENLWKIYRKPMKPMENLWETRCHHKRALPPKKYFFWRQRKTAGGKALFLEAAQNGWRKGDFPVTSAKPAAWPLPGNRT